MGSKVINNGLLCSILHVMSAAPNEDELIARIEHDVAIDEILEARKKLFSYFSDVICSERKKPILDVDRHTTKRYIKDIVDQLVKIDKNTDVKIFCMPYDYDRHKFESESTKLTNVIEREISNEFDNKIEALEHRMNEKHRALHDSIVESVNRALQQKSGQSEPSYASVAFGGARPKTGAGITGATGPPPVILSVPGGQHQGLTAKDNYMQNRAPEGAVGGQPNGGEHLRVQSRLLERVRGRSPSVKRLRSEDGSPVTVTGRSGSRQPKQKCVVGTSNNAVQTGRKMRSPPADIFVWGIHPETTVQDIIADLADSGVIIQEKDVEKKSKAEAFLCSYKISVRAEHLQTALDPTVWPLRVKVREYIYYSKKNPRQENNQQRARQGGEQPQPRQDGPLHGGHAADQAKHEQGELSLIQNRYVLPDGVLPDTQV